MGIIACRGRHARGRGVITALTCVVTSVAFLMAAEAQGRSGEGLDASALIAGRYRVEPNVVYLSVGGWEGKLDMYVPRRPSRPMPVALLFHGGGWVSGTRSEIALDALPYLTMGFVVVNVDYRLARVAPAPAAVEDSRCALRWVVRHAEQYDLDASRLVLVGSSSGAHLALVAALAPVSAGFDRLCPDGPTPHVRAVINFFGVTDVSELIQPPNARDFAIGWIGNGPDRERLARRVSPLTYIAPGAPAIFTAHGEADPVIPFEQAQRLHTALDKVGAPNVLFPVRGAGHGQFDGDEVLRLNRAVRDFLVKQRVIKAQTSREATTSPARP